MKMLHPVYEIDTDGYVMEIYAAELDGNGNIISEDKLHCIANQVPNNLHRPKWNGSDWVEGESEVERAEREAKQQLDSFLPSQEELTNAELEIKMIALLTELGVLT